jgi:hypothetical protein
VIRGVKFGTAGPHITHLLFADYSIVFLEAVPASFNTLKKVLQDYEISSGQKVNLQKSSLFFGPGCTQDQKAELKRNIGISCEALSECYLGLPTVVGRSKEGCFKYITERSWGKVKGWKGQGMSKEAKCILVKSVLQAVPAFPMSCFLFTKNQCKKLSSISSNFWWGAKDGQRKVHWIGWDRMCKRKENGGLGFRDFECFNQALLAKQGWRLITDPDSLCSCVLKARYFKEGDFLTANCPKRASYTWRSIVHGRELLREGLVWWIGSGESIKTRCKLEEGCPKTVKGLLLPGGGAWNKAELREFFHDHDVEDILKTTVGRPGSEDFLAWNHTKNALFSVRSAYHLAIEHKKWKRGIAESSRSCDHHKGWLAMWSANVPGKVKVHFCRLIENGLAVGSELEHQRIKDGVTCLVCGKEESLIHRFWKCSHSSTTWNLLATETGVSLEKPPARLLYHTDLKWWLLDWIGKAHASSVERMMLLVYNL